VPSDQVPNLPIKLCSSCRSLIVESYAFKLKCVKNTRLLIATLQETDGDLYELGNLDKFTQTDEHSTHDDINFEDENFDSLILKEDAIFSGSDVTNPIILATTSPVSVKVELEGKVPTEVTADEENVNESDRIGALTSEEFVYDVNPFTQNEQPATVTHECDKCGKNFARATHLKRHLMTHEDFKPIQCTSCEKRFTRMDHLNHHVLSHHSESKPFHCDVPDCRKGFLKEGRSCPLVV
jgi:Zinc finger, C2H2 type